MKKKLFRVCILVLEAVVLLSFLGCPQPGEEDNSSKKITLSEDDVNNVARGSILTGMTSIMIPKYYKRTDSATVEAKYPGLDITEGSSGVSFVYTNALVDMNEDSSPDVIINGSYIVSDNGATITLSNYTIAYVSKPSDTYTISGSYSLSGSNPEIVTSALSVSGSLFSQASTVASIMSLPQDAPPTFTSATINGNDYLSDFNKMVSTISEN